MLDEIGCDCTPGFVLHGDVSLRLDHHFLAADCSAEILVRLLIGGGSECGRKEFQKKYSAPFLASGEVCREPFAPGTEPLHRCNRSTMLNGACRSASLSKVFPFRLLAPREVDCRDREEFKIQQGCGNGIRRQSRPSAPITKSRSALRTTPAIKSHALNSRLQYTKSLGARLGLTVHESPLRYKLLRIWRLLSPDRTDSLEDWLLATANHRGADVVSIDRVYDPCTLPDRDQLPDEELAGGLCLLQESATAPPSATVRPGIISRGGVDLAQASAASSSESVWSQ